MALVSSLFKEEKMPKKELLLYAPVANADSYRLEEVVATVVPQPEMEMVHTPGGLFHRLRRLNNGLRVAVILAAGRKELGELLSLGLMLEGLRVILIIPDADPQTISQGHRLRPRYISLIDSDFQDVAAVLRRILRCSRSTT